MPKRNYKLWIAMLIPFILLGLYYYMGGLAQVEESEYSYEYVEPKAIDYIDVVSSVPVLNSSVATFSITVRNRSGRDIKDIEFKFIYYGESGTEIGSGRETSYKIFPADSDRTIEVKELAHSQSTKVETIIVGAEWTN